MKREEREVGEMRKKERKGNDKRGKRKWSGGKDYSGNERERGEERREALPQTKIYNIVSTACFPSYLYEGC